MILRESECEYDIVVVGAGPGGLASAKSAVENGVKVLVVEEHSAIGTPVQCGEIFHKYLLKELELDNEKGIIANKPKRARIISPNKKFAEISISRTSESPLVIVERKVLEKKLAVCVANKGVDIFTRAYATSVIKKNDFVSGVNVLHFGELKKVKAKVVIACDGPTSNIARSAGLNVCRDIDDFDSCIQFQMANIDIDEETAEIYLGGCAPGGYVWILPKQKKFANVGLGVSGKIGNKALNYLIDFIHSDVRLKKGSVIEVNAGIVPLSSPSGRLVSNGLMLVGDSARQVNPATGGGMIFAIKAGIAAGKIAAEAVKNNDSSENFLSQYEKIWFEEIGKRFDGFNALKRLFLTLSDKDIDNIVESIGNIEMPDAKEPWHPVLSHIIKIVIKNPRFAFKFAKILPYFIM